ncbi:MAG TPA: type II secretion system F family protein [Isosphaeraceae bacterium]|jgi:tight adherence protein C
MSDFMTSGLPIFLATFSLILAIYLLATGRPSRLESRVQSLAEGIPEEGAPTEVAQPSMIDLARSTLPKLGTHLVPDDEEEKTLLRSRMIHAGFYSRQAMYLFLGIKMIMILMPIALGFLAAVLHVVPFAQGVLGGACLGVMGMIGPSFWLDYRKGARQMVFRRALPDALDVIVICLDGGLSLPGALKRVASELRTAHPELALELNVVQREIQLGRSPGEALKQMGLRTDLEEVRNLASVIIQSERFGASLVKSLRVHADTLRLKRKQRAEELAQKAVVKVLFPTLLFIFPAIFVVILGPAAIQIMDTFSKF